MSNALNLILEEIKQEVNSIILKVNKKHANKADELSAIYDIYNGLKEIDLQLKEVKKSVLYIENVEDNIKVLLRTKNLSSIESILDKKQNIDNINLDISLDKVKVMNNVYVNSLVLNNHVINSLTPFINCPLYYCNNYNKFYLKVSGQLISGGLCNIYNKKDNNVCKAFKCKWGSFKACNENRKYVKCKYYHDGEIRNYLWSDIKKLLLSSNSIKTETIISKDEKKMLGSLIIHCILLLHI